LRRCAVPAIMRHSHAMTTSHVAATVPLPPPVARPQDAQLRQDVRWLAATLGRVVGRLAGEDTFRAVEELRRACRARRLGVPGAPDLDTLLARTRSLPPETARLTAVPSRCSSSSSMPRSKLIGCDGRAKTTGRGAARIGALVAAPPPRGRPGSRRGHTRPAHARRPTGPHRASHRVRPAHDPRPPARLAEGLLARDGAPEPSAAPSRGVSRARWSSSGSRRSAARSPVRDGRGLERPLVSRGPPPGGRVARARAAGPGVRGRVRRRAGRGDSAEHGQLGRGRPGRQPVRHGGDHARRRAQRSPRGARLLRAGSG